MGEWTAGWMMERRQVNWEHRAFLCCPAKMPWSSWVSLGCVDVWGTRSCWQRAQSVLIPLMAEEDLHLHLGIPDALFKLVLSWTPPLDDTSQECQHLSAAYCPKCLCSHSFNSGSLPMNWVKSHFTDRRLRHKRGRERLSKSPQVT